MKKINHTHNWGDIKQYYMLLNIFKIISPNSLKYKLFPLTRNELAKIGYFYQFFAFFGPKNSKIEKTKKVPRDILITIPKHVWNPKSVTKCAFGAHVHTPHTHTHTKQKVDSPLQLAMTMRRTEREKRNGKTNKKEKY